MTMTMDLISLIVTRNEWVIPKTVPRSVWAIDCSLYQWRAVFNWSPLCDQVSQSTIPRCQGGVFDVPSQPRSWFISIAAQNAVFSVIKLQKRRRKKIMKFVHKELKTLFLNSVDIFIPFQPCSIPDQRPPVPIVDWSKVNNRSAGNLTTLQMFPKHGCSNDPNLYAQRSHDWGAHGIIPIEHCQWLCLVTRATMLGDSCQVSHGQFQHQRRKRSPADIHTKPLLTGLLLSLSHSCHYYLYETK